MSQFANKPSALLVVSDNFLAKQLTDSLHILGYKTVRAALARDCYSAWSSPERFSICLIDQHLADQQGQVLAKYLAENRAKNEQCHAGRESQRFLCPRQEDVNPEGILVNLHCGERADTVHDGPNLRELANNRHDFLKGIHGAGGCFVVNQGNGIEFTGSQLLANVFRIDRGAPFVLQGLGFLATALGNVKPLV